jgi:predicted RNA binding protein YcfA (HicA-like mRNA interferase family)
MVGGRLPAVSGRDVVRVLLKAVFVVERTAGSHHILVHSSDRRRTVTVPVHAGHDLKRGTLRSIIRQAGFTVDEFTDLL